jgi:hypothetical protein
MGEPRFVSLYVGQDSSSSRLWRQRSYSPSGLLLKEYRNDSNATLYYHSLHPRFDSTKGLRDYLSGMWIRKEPEVQYKTFNMPDGGQAMAKVKSNIARTFRRDTLIMAQYMTVSDPKSGRTVGHDVVEIGMGVDFLPPNRIALTEVYYRRRPDTSQVLSDTPILSPVSSKRIVDTLRVYGPNRYRVRTAVRKDQMFKRHATGARVPGRLPEEFQ